LESRTVSSVHPTAPGRANDFPEGVALAAESIDSGAARARLDQLVRFTRDA
jgi:anthranilate phosphoribosyltransferase